MSTILAYSDRLRSYLQHENNPPFKLIDPIKLDEGQKEMLRHKTYHGIFYKQSNDIEFIKEARSKLISIYNAYGINAQIRFYVQERHPKTDEWITRSDGFLGIKTIAITKTTVSFKYDIDSLLKLIKSRQSQKIEVERLDTIDGKTIPALKIDKVALIPIEYFKGFNWPPINTPA